MTGNRAQAPSLPAGLVVSSHGRHCMLEAADGRRLLCHAKGKKNQVVVGDRVLWRPSADEGVVEAVLPRRNLLYRQDVWKTKYFAANLDGVLVVLGAEPVFSQHQLARAVIACEAAGIDVAIVLNKADLVAAFATAWDRLAPYRQMNYPVLPLSLHGAGNGLSELVQRLANRTTLVLGPSGAGKSTLINHLVPGTDAQTQAISTALNSGKHTTTQTTWYWADAQRQTAVLDSPGFQEFGLQHLKPQDLARCMRDLQPHAAHCRFSNCTHRQEPGCAVTKMVKPQPSPGEISEVRYKIYCDLFAELSQPTPY